MMIEALQIAAGGALAVGAMVLVEWLRKPRMSFEIIAVPRDTWPDGLPAKEGRFVRVKLVNHALPVWARWMCRNAALKCHGSISFHHLDGQDVFGRKMALRWTGTLEPTIKTVVVEGTKIPYIDPRAFPPQTTVDVYAGESEAIDIAGRLDDDEVCYGWSNESYFCDPPWRNPRWKLDRGRYIVRVEVLSGGESICDLFRLINDVDATSFRLEKTQQDDRRAIAKASN